MHALVGIAEQKEVTLDQSAALRNTQARPITLADEPNPALRAAIAWSAGLDKAPDGLLTRMAQSLTAAEAEQLIRAHTLGQ